MFTVRRVTSFALGVWLASGVFLPARTLPVDQHEHGALAHQDNTVCVLRLDPRNMFTRVSPSEAFVLSRLAGVQPDNAVAVTVNYIGTWPTDARTAFQYAVDIWKSQLTSAVPVIVDAEFRSDLGEGVLGSAGAAYNVANFSGAPMTGTWYAAALANKLVGSDLYISDVDISARFSSTFDWYYGTDRATPANRVDFVSVVLHELCHGLGFAGSAQVFGGLGYIRDSTYGYPVIYDRFIENGSAQPILNFTTGTAALAAQLQGDSLYWNGSSGVSGAGGSKPRIYAPATWRQGSSYSHLNELTYPAGNANSLMTYAIGYAEAIHDPGPITRGMFTDVGWTTVAPGCSYSVSPTTSTATAAGGSATVSVTTTSGCAWTATSHAAYITITGGSSGTGSGTVSYTVAANTGQARSGTMTVAGSTVTVNQAVNSSLPTLTPSPTSLSFGAVNTGGVLSVQTPAQRVTVSQSSGTGVSWTASSNVSWLTIASADVTKSGTGTFSVTLNNTGNVLPASGTLTGTITMTAPGAQRNPTMAVRVTTYPPAGAAAPVGMVDTPAQNTTGAAGSIGVTGWAVDDVGIASVKLYRRWLSEFEPEANYSPAARGLDWNGVHLVYMGDADVVPGARPDVELAYPTHPQAYRAGWGYLLLTNMLPHIPNKLMYGGEGTVSIYVMATDIEGHVTLLGRSNVLDATPTALTMANDTAVKPFGAIDSPGQGQTVSGALANWGWALTPDANRVGNEAGDILVPTNGSTIWVWIDGAPVAHPTVNMCRSDKSSLNPTVPSLLYCDDDVANIFGNLTPQPTFQARTSNNSKYRNLDAGRGAIGVHVIDTTKLPNGRRSIVWSVTDSAGRVDGVGSRDFIVLNASTDARDAWVPGSEDPGLHPNDTSRSNESRWSPGSSDPGLRSDGGRGAPPDTLPLDAPPATYGDAGAVGALPRKLDVAGQAAVAGRTGFDVHAPLDAVAADADGVRYVQLPQLGRLELRLGPVEAGYLVANGTLRDLPVGSRLDPATGLFTWTPGPAFFGTYHLVFVAGGTQIPVYVTIQPSEEPSPGESQVRMHLDAPDAWGIERGSFVVAGWALDPHAAFGAGIGAVHVWAQRRDIPGAEPEFLGEAALGGARPDVAAVHGARFHPAGFGLYTPALPPGEYDVMVFVWSARTQRWEDARTVPVTVR